MKHAVRSTLLFLGTGVVAQRVLQLVAFVIVGRTLGAAGLGAYAQGLAVAAVLTVLAGAGVRNLVARAISRQPGAARPLVANAVYQRLLVGLMLALTVGMVAFIQSPRPWFWLLCALHVAPAAFDLKNLVDAAGRTRREVVLDGSAAVLQLAAIAVWAGHGGQDVTALAGISLSCRCVYAAGALVTIRSLPADELPRHVPLAWSTVGVGQTMHELLAIGDVAWLGMCCGDAVAGYYAVAMRFATAAMLPASQLARLLLPHLLHASRRGDADRTLATALRSSLWLTAPICAGGIVVAEPLCALSGGEFATSAPALQLLLFAGLCQQLGWQCSHALLAAGRDRAYAHGLIWPAVLHAGSLVALAATLPADHADATVALIAATIAAFAYASYLTGGLSALGCGDAIKSSASGPLLAALATAVGAAVPVDWLAPELQLPARIALGAAGFVVVLWACELRGRIGRVGDGLASASGLVD